jgi:probable phosphomutase (TIGR03848 family)
MCTLARRGLKSRYCNYRDNLRVVARLILLRHAHSVANEAGILSGQLPGISLSKKGFEQAELLVERIGKSSFDSIRVSPMQRCHETIAPWLASTYSQGISDFQIDDGIIEVNYGSWSGRKLRSLSRDPLWKVIQFSPSVVKFPGGEGIKAMQARAMESIESAYASKKSGTHLFISHGDVIKAIVAKLLVMKLDNFQSLVVDPASITILDYDGKSARLLAFNDSTSSVAPLTAMQRTPRVLLGGGSRVSKGKTSEKVIHAGKARK